MSQFFPSILSVLRKELKSSTLLHTEQSHFPRKGKLFTVTLNAISDPATSQI